ncbi:amino acid/amide ABC transporter ATP-binding protein 1, HAAT family [Halobiforma haloterrestris]|uniref:Amino acid/amide ABC transporter ATP-binding protein 1, HAAT family n=1 Tax=Natronobacterium haloterrestre TaxID=148448 RepID=A0A1I1FFV7_NATHA|nr:ABC transporter ATP-binding protein [Halobiforma haloterrestris]SFB97862.1 amino acid/amide ABC transporter ATP-binding protein 1, HAAT family [Halobiforma haloterrestris]
MLLSTQNLTKEFGGITAVDGVDFRLEEDELCSVIGPNGAGKTTFFNLLTGVLEPTRGTIEFSPSGGGGLDGGAAGSDGMIDITDAPSHETALLGLHRSYQVTNIFPTVSVRENVRVAVQAHRDGDSWRFWRNVDAFEDHVAEADAILERIGLLEYADEPAENLSHGEKRNLEIGIALAGDPDVLLLDEPTAGVSSEDVDRVTDIIEDVAEDHAVMLIEHNMDVVMEISDRVAVLNQGDLIAQGEPDEIRESEAVQRAYLGGYEGNGTGDGTSSASEAATDGGEFDPGVSAG